MAKFPALPLFTDAYMADTRHLSTIQHGAYLLLLMTAWRMPDCTLPNDDSFLCRISGMDHRTWKNNKAVILEFFNVDNSGRLYQKRLNKERNYVVQLSNKNSDASKARWLKYNNSDDANAMPNRCQTDAPIPTPTPTPIQNKPPVLPITAQGEGEVLKKKDGEVWEVMHHLTEKGLQRAREACDGWDIYYLAGVYNQAVKKMGIPNNADAAFPAWCVKYTKGKRP